jgi:uncharacterized protein
MTEGVDESGPGNIDPDSEFYWAALRRHQISVQRCSSCRSSRLPPMPACPRCGETATEIVDSSGSGQVYSWITVHRSADPALQPDLPYSIGTIDLDIGVRVFGRLVGTDRPGIGDRVEACFVDHPTWTELRFTPVPERVGSAAGESR